MVTLKIVSSLDKLFYDACDPPMLSEGECAATELHNFQLVIFSTENFAGKLNVESDLHIDIYKQSFVKGTKKKEKNDEFFIKDCDEYPDPLEIFEGDVQCDANKKIYLWASVPANQRVGIHTIKFSLLDAKAEYTLNIFDCVSQKTLPITDWMHIDCICAMHGVTPYSKEFYDVFEKYISYYVLGGNTMLFTPIFTPALDIEEGKYRPTTQLLKIRKDGNKYIFDFSKVKEYIEFASARGVRYFEFSHLFTQWGAQHCPKIVDGNGTMLFGWDSDSYTSPYKKFLCQYFRALKKFATENALTHKIFIHISDEPSDKHAKHYIRLSKFVKKRLKNFKVFDAVSCKEVVERAKLDYPVIANLSHKIISDLKGREYFFYYACDDFEPLLTNRFMYFPLQRVRMLGAQLFLNRASGFLHWGFNFYNTQLSKATVDPYVTTDAGGAFPSGDSFIVYAKKEEVNPSLRLFTMREAIDDYYALKQMESVYGFAFCKQFLKKYGFEGYIVPTLSSGEFLQMRKEINGYLLTKRH